MHTHAFTSTYYGNLRLTSLGRAVSVHSRSGGGSARCITLWEDKKGGLWARKPGCKDSVLGPYRPVGLRYTEKGAFYYFI